MPERFEKLQIQPAYKVVSEAIEEQILDRRIKPGDQLPSEVDLATQFGVNRSTVREGIRLLEQSGLVRRDGSKRLSVCLPRYADLSSRVQRAMILHQITFHELWELAMALEPAIAAIAAGSSEPALVDAIGENVERTEEALDKGDAILDLDLEFHELVARVAGNRAMSLAREPFAMLLYPAFGTLLPLLPQSGPRLLTAHRIIHECLRDGDQEKAELWMRKHVVDFKRGYQVAGLDLGAPVDRKTAADAAAGPQ